MFRSLRLTCTVTLFAASALVPSFANGEHYRSKGKDADLYTYEVDSTGCIYIDTVLSVSESQARSEPGRTEPSTRIYFYRTVYDACIDYYLMAFNVDMSVPADSFRADSQLRSGSFQTTIMIRPWIYGEGEIAAEPMTFDLVWTGGSDVQQGGRTTRDRNEGYLRITRSTGTYRPATISGSITFRSTNILGSQYSHATLADYTSSETLHLNLKRPN